MSSQAVAALKAVMFALAVGVSLSIGMMSMQVGADAERSLIKMGVSFGVLMLAGRIILGMVPPWRQPPSRGKAGEVSEMGEALQVEHLGNGDRVAVE